MPLPSLPQSNSNQMTPAQFAASVREKYPAYANIPDDKLVNAVLEKYPVYRSSINFGTPAQAAPYGDDAVQRATQSEAQSNVTGSKSPISKAIQKKEDSLRALSSIAGYDTAPKDEAEARKRLGETTRKYAEGELGLYSMGIPGPGKATSFVGQIMKGAAAGGATSSGIYTAQKLIRGELPSASGLATSTIGGVIFGGIAEPLLNIPAISRAVARIPALKKLLPLTKDEEFNAKMEAKAQDLMRRGKEQDALDLKQAVAARRATREAQLAAKQAERASKAKAAGEVKPFGEGMTATNSPNLPSAPKASAGLPAPPQPEVKYVDKFEKPGKSKIVEPGSEPPMQPVTYQSVPKDDLYRMGKGGDIQALHEIMRRGLPLPPNASYLLEEARTKPWRNYKR